LSATEIAALYNRGLTTSETFVMSRPVVYTYDLAGNQTSRNQITLKSTSYIEKRDSVGLGQSGKDGNVEGLIFEENLGDKKVTITPNPTKGALNISVNGYKDGLLVSFYVYNLSGKLLMTRTNLSSSFLVDLTQYPKGTYILKLALGNNVSNWKIIRE